MPVEITSQKGEPLGAISYDKKRLIAEAVSGRIGDAHTTPVDAAIITHLGEKLAILTLRRAQGLPVEQHSIGGIRLVLKLSGQRGVLAAVDQITGPPQRKRWRRR